MGSLVRGPWAIAWYTWREGRRKKAIVGFLVLSLLTIFGSNFVTAFLFESGGSDITGAGSDVDTKIVKDICLAAVSIFGILITIFISASVVPNEVDNKVVYTILSKPVRRLQYLIGKFAGVQIIVLHSLIYMGALFFLAIYIKEGNMPLMLIWSLILTYFQFLIVSAFTFAVASTASSPVLPTIAGLFIYITGLLTEYLKDVWDRAGQTTQFLDEFIGRIAYWLYLVLPNLSAFSIRNELLDAQPGDWFPTEALIPRLILYGIIYSASGFVLAYWVFRRKEL